MSYFQEFTIVLYCGKLVTSCTHKLLTYLPTLKMGGGEYLFEVGLTELKTFCDAIYFVQISL